MIQSNLTGESSSLNPSHVSAPQADKYTGTIPKTLPILTEEQRKQIFNARIAIDPFAPGHSLRHSPPPLIGESASRESVSSDLELSSDSGSTQTTLIATEILKNTSSVFSKFPGDRSWSNSNSEDSDQSDDTMPGDSSKLTFRDAVVYLKEFTGDDLEREHFAKTFSI